MTAHTLTAFAPSLIENRDRFWGHLGLRLPGASHSKWYAVTKAEADQVRQELAAGYDVPEWIVTETLDNRVLAWRPKQMQRVWLLDDASDGPKGDWKHETQWDAGCGMSVEIYAEMADWADEQMESSSKNQSTNLRREALSAIERGGFLANPQGLAAELRHTAIHFLDGTTVEYEADRQNLVSISTDLEGNLASDFVEISGAESDFESFYPASQIRMVEIPMIELEAGRRELEREFAEQDA